MTVTRDQELWALALKVEEQHGNDGPRHIADMIGKAALAGDDTGVNLWKRIAERFDRLTEFSLKS